MKIEKPGVGRPLLGPAIKVRYRPQKLCCNCPKTFKAKEHNKIIFQLPNLHLWQAAHCPLHTASLHCMLHIYHFTLHTVKTCLSWDSGWWWQNEPWYIPCQYNSTAEVKPNKQKYSQKGPHSKSYKDRPPTNRCVCLIELLLTYLDGVK